jgi:hypothetical protein
MRYAGTWCAAAALVLGLTVPVGGLVGQVKTADVYKNITYSVPDAAAFHFIGANPREISTPSSVGALGLGVAGLVDSAGRFRNGIAIDLAPRRFFSISRAEYVHSLLARLITNLSLSVGSIAGAGDSTSTDVGLGVRTVLVDHSDPARVSNSVLAEALRVCAREAAAIPDSDAAVAAAGKCAVRVGKAYTDSLWNELAVSLGAATGWRLRQSRWSQRSALGSAFWATIQFPLCLGNHSSFCRRGIVLAQVQFDHRDSLATAAAHSGVTFGVRAVYGTADLHGFAEVVGYQATQAPAGVARSYGDGAVGLEWQPSKGAWVTIGLGQRFAQAGIKNQVRVLGGLRVGLNGKPNFAPAP